MKANFILENFDQYVREVYHPLNEAEGQGLNQDEAKRIIEYLIEFQSKKALGTSSIKKLVTEIFGDVISKSMSKNPGKWAGTDQGVGVQLSGADDKIADPVRKKKEEFFKKIVEFDSRLKELKLSKNKDFRPAVIMGLFSQFMTEGSKKELEKALSKRASELKLSYNKIYKQIEKKGTDSDTAGQPPAILGYVSEEEIERVKVTPPTPPKAISLLDTKQQNTLFLDNSWTLNPEVGKALRNNLLGVLERRKQGAYTKITELSITSSASRYRNTKGKFGNAESLSWGQLAFKRAQVIHNMIKEILEELQVPEGDPIREELNKVATMNIKGSNGDGTSGPNPLPDPTLGKLRVGYYRTTTKQTKDQTGVSKFVDEDVNSPEKVYIVQIDDLGNTISEPKVNNMPLLEKKEDYDKFKFVNVIVKFEETNITPGQLGSVQIKKVPEGTIAPVVILERKGVKGGGGGWSFRVPKIPNLNILSWFTGGGPDQCLICQCGEF